ncbi:MAG TPA: hypothetical protein VMW23_00200 [Sedimentisphaerales bacterium]|nr:hypothetical protein [Sedimentisphaerales bacterium]
MAAEVPAKANIKLNTVRSGFVSIILPKIWVENNKVPIKVSMGTRKAASTSAVREGPFLLVNCSKICRQPGC